MKMMNAMKSRKLAIGVIACLMFVLSVAPSFAATSEVWIEVEATRVDIDIPGGGEGEDSDTAGGALALPIVFHADGSNTYPTNWEITNNSKIGSVTLKKISMTGNGWKLLPASTDTKLLPVDTREIKFYMGSRGQELEQVVPSGDSADTTGSVELVRPIEIEAESTEVFDFKVDRAAFSEAAASSKAFDIELTFEF